MSDEIDQAEGTLPPTTAPEWDEDEFAKLPGWPKVVGIISIVFSGLSLTCMGCGVVSMVAFLPMARNARPEGEPLPPSMDPSAVMQTLQFTQMGIGLLLTVLLLMAGIMTLSRKNAGRMLHLLYGGLSLPVAMFGVWIQLKAIAEMEQWLLDNPDSTLASSPGSGTGGMMIGLGIGLVIGLAYPLFCLIWFGAIKTKHEQMTGGIDDDVI